jgi:aspartyl-tRNA(Asn)/glutamyl-tRNA(Gln) amidotransferase subunit C
MLTNKDVSYIAALARIHVPESELEDFTHTLEKIISYVDQLSELKVDGVEPTSHVLHLKNVYRADVKKPSLPQNEALSTAVESHQGFFKVPRVIE